VTVSASAPLSLALHRYLVPWEVLDWPVDWPSVFARRAPLVLEAGFGNGDFLTDLARRDPATDHVGIEISWGSVQRLVRRASGANLGNVRVLQGDAAFLVEKVFAPGSLSGMYVNFSDPWRKARHHRRRLVRPDFVAVLAGRLAPGAPVTIATDHAEYADWIAEVLEGQTALEPALGATRVREFPGRRPTRYEAKALAVGTPISYFVWRRAAGLEAPPPVTERVEPMPNVNLRGPFPSGDAFDPADRVYTETHRGVEVVIKVTDLYRHHDRPEWLAAVLVKEGPFQQAFGIQVLARGENNVLVKPAGLGGPRPTWGVKRAVLRVAELVLEAHPELQLRSTTVGHAAED